MALPTAKAGILRPDTFIYAIEGLSVPGYRKAAMNFQSVKNSLKTVSFPHLGKQAVVGSSEPALLNLTSSAFLKNMASSYAQNDAIISMHQNDKKLSFKQFDHLASVLATRLYEQGVRKGHRVAVCAGNLWQYPVLQFGLARLGAILVPMNPAFTLPQFERALKSTESNVLIIQDSLFGGRNKPRKDMSQLIDLFGATHNKKVFVLPSADSSSAQEFGDRHFDQLVEGEPSDMIEQYALEQAPDEIINMQLTSGTTSDPKISCLTHVSLINNGALIGNRMGLKPGNLMCVPVPMFHCFGLILSNMACFSTGAGVVYPSEGFSAPEALEAVKKYKCHALQGVPTMFAAELDLHNEIKEGGFENLRTGIAAGSSVPIEIMRSLDAKMGMNELTICYGMTETSPVSFMSYPDDPVEKRVSTVGTVMPHTSARIVSPNSNSLDPLPYGQPGEIVVSGYLLQKCYFKEPTKTAEAMIDLPDGTRWMRTGDEGIIDEEGFLRVTGRIKDLIIRGGENIHPLEIEEVLFEHPAVSQASIVGVPDERYGEAIAAFIILHPENKNAMSESEMTENILNFVKEKLGHFMVPKFVYYVADFPKTASGKIRKVDLKMLHNENTV